MGVYWPPAGNPTYVVSYTYGGVPVDQMEPDALKRVLKSYMNGEAIRLSEKYGMPCSCEKPTVYTRPSGQRICVNDGCGLAIAKPETATRKERP